jgi:biopolymer transport protein ExbB/TolQ/uncharacterized protein YerC
VLPALAIVLAVAASSLVYELGSPSGFLFRILRVDSPMADRLIPVAIMVLLFWTLIDLIVTWHKLSKERRTFATPAMAELPATLGKFGPSHALQAARDSDGGTSPTVERLQRLLQRLSTSGNPQLAHESFRHDSELASEQSDESYSTVRILIWAMPILGFIGTVLGIGLAVGEFSGFLTGDIDDVELVKGELAKIASGLSFAFDTTLLGLLGSLIAMLTMSWVQKGDRELNAGVEALGLILISNCKTDAPTLGVQTVFDDEVVGRINAGLQAVVTQNERLSGGIGQLEQSSRQLAVVLKQAIPVQESLRESTQLAAQSESTLAAGIGRSVQNLVESLASLESRVDAMLRGNDAYEAAAQEMSSMGRRFDQLIDLLEDTQQNRQVMGELSASIANLERVQRASVQILGQFSRPLELRLAPSNAEHAATNGDN